MKLLYILLIVFGLLFLILIPTIIHFTISNKKYKCVNNNCIQDISGSYKSLNDCEIACNSPSKYKCQNGKCVQDSSGIFDSLTDCKSKCTDFITYINNKLSGTQYKTFTGSTSFQDAKDFCSKDINCQGINRLSNSASVVKDVTGIIHADGVYASIIPSSKGKYIATSYGFDFNLVGTEYKQTTQFSAYDTDKINKYCLDDKDCQGINNITDDKQHKVSLVKDVTGVTGVKDDTIVGWFYTRFG